MATVRFGAGGSGQPAFVIAAVDAMVEAELMSWSTLSARLVGLDGRVYILGGTGFTHGYVYGEHALVAGTLHQVRVFASNADWIAQRELVTVSDLSLSMADIQAAIVAEWFGTNRAALENILMDLDWTFYGTDTPAILREGAVSSDNVVINLRGDDLARLGAGNDQMFMGGGDDTVYGGAGNDVLSGGSGADRLCGDAGDDNLFGGDGSDRLYGGKGKDMLVGGSGNDRLYGGKGNDTLQGGNGSDRLFGGAGNDRLFGGKGSDTLYAGAGSDQLTGGQGADTFVWASASESVTGRNRDRITDFETGIDRIDISALHDDLVLVGAFSGVAGQVVYVRQTGILSVDVTGNGGADFTIGLTAGTMLAEGDLIL